jgi:hypothetical protein
MVPKRRETPKVIWAASRACLHFANCRNHSLPIRLCLWHYDSQFSLEFRGRMRSRLWICSGLLTSVLTTLGQTAAIHNPLSTRSSKDAALSISLSADTQTTTTTLTLSSSSVASGTAETLAATVTADGSPVSPGTVTFCDVTAKYCEAPAVLGTAQLTSAGIASIKLFLDTGTHSIKAVFGGTDSYAPSTPTAHTLTITGSHPTATTIVSSGSPDNYTLATIVGGGDTAKGPTANVCF